MPHEEEEHVDPRLALAAGLAPDSLFGLALGAGLVILIVWTNVVVPSHESDDEYTSRYLVFLAGLLV